MTDSAWAGLDINEVQERVQIGEGTHPVVVYGNWREVTGDQAEDQLTPHRFVIRYRATDPNDPHYNLTREEWFPFYPTPDFDKDWYEGLGEQDQITVRKNMARAKSRLKQLGFDPEEMAVLHPKTPEVTQELFENVEGDLVIVERASQKDDRIFLNIQRFSRYE